MLYFILLALAAFIVASYMLQHKLEIILGIFTITYFVLHVLLNEYTFLNRELSSQVSYSFLISFLALFAPLFFISLQHPAFFYDFKLTYPLFTSERMMTILDTAYPVSFIWAISLMSIIGFTVVTPYLALKQIGRGTALTIAILGMVSTFLILTNVPINFVYMLHFILVYHFILLFLIFYVYFKRKNQQSLRNYVYLHVVATACILGVYFWPLFTDGQNTFLKENVFNFGVFLGVSLIHISVSFLNEPWLMAGLKRYRLLDSDN